MEKGTRIITKYIKSIKSYRIISKRGEDVTSKYEFEKIEDVKRHIKEIVSSIMFSEAGSDTTDFCAIPPRNTHGHFNRRDRANYSSLMKDDENKEDTLEIDISEIEDVIGGESVDEYPHLIADTGNNSIMSERVLSVSDDFTF